jgi:K+/H+ antiporter YhaU regulatory subunit KhtT
MTWNPRGDERLGPGDVLVVAGARAELDRAERLASSVGADRA